MKLLSLTILVLLTSIQLKAQEAWPWMNDGFVRINDPNSGKGRELFGYLQSVNEGGAELKLEGKEILIHGLE